MLKKGIAAAALVAATTGAYAGGPEAPPPAYIGGIYVDVGLSRDDVADNFRQNSTTTLTNVNNNFVTVGPNTFNRVNAGAPGWDGFVGFGYTYVWDNEWTLGLEFFGDLSTASGTQLMSNNPVNLVTGAFTTSWERLRLTRTLGVSLMPGYFVAPGSLYFLELGYVNSRFQLQGFPNPVPLAFQNTTGLPTANADLSGFRLGVGTNTQVGTHVAVRQEYIWEAYDNLNANITGGIQGIIADQTQRLLATRQVRVSPSVGKFNLAAVYYFARQGNAPDLQSAPAQVGGHFYAGLNGSYEEVSSQALYWNNRTTNFDINNVLTADNSVNLSGTMKVTGWDLGLLGGYGWNFSNRWYIGSELFVNFDSLNGSANQDQTGTTVTTPAGAVFLGQLASSTITRLQKQWDFGVALLPGFQVSDHALIYGRVGYVGAQFRTRTLLAGGWFPPGNVNGNPNLTAVQNGFLGNFNGRSSWLSGLQLGVGVDTWVYENLSLRTEFNINQYENLNNNLLTGVNINIINGVPLGQTTTVVSARQRNLVEDQFNVALIWHFFG